MSFITNNFILLPLCFFLVLVMVYSGYSKAGGFLYKKTFGKKEDIIKYLRLMGSSPDEKKLNVTILLLSYGLGALAFMLLWPFVVPGAIAAVVLIVVGWNLPFWLAKMTYENRCTKFVDQMVDGLTIMANGIKAGSNPQESMKRVVEIMSAPIKDEFNQVLLEMQAGESFENALNNLGNRIPRPDVQMFVTSVNILKETGGDLGVTFTTIVLTIRERQKVEKKIQALTAQGLTQGVILTLIPFILILIFMVTSPDLIKPMFNTTLGIILLMVMLALQIIGGVLIKKIVTIKV